MDDDFIVTAFVVIDTAMAALRHRNDVRARASDAAVLTVAIVAARYFQGHLARALHVMRLGHYLSGPRSVSRFSSRARRLVIEAGLGVQQQRQLRAVDLRLRRAVPPDQRLTFRDLLRRERRLIGRGRSCHRPPPPAPRRLAYPGHPYSYS